MQVVEMNQGEEIRSKCGGQGEAIIGREITKGFSEELRLKDKWPVMGKPEEKLFLKGVRASAKLPGRKDRMGSKSGKSPA